MSVKSIRAAVTRAQRDGKVTEAEVDAIALKARSGKGLDAAERTELLKLADTFDDAGKQRLLRHLSAMTQQHAWVNVQAGAVASVQGRYADLAVGVPGLSVKLGLFDNCFAIKGAARADGTLKLNVEGQALSVQVKRGETAAQVLEKVRGALPREVSGVLLSGEVQPWDAASFQGRGAGAHEEAAHLMLWKPASLGLQPGELPLKVVVTGYGAFMGITDNPSAAMAQRLAEAGVRGGIVEYRRLDVTPEAVDAFMAELRRSPPDVVLSMGVTHGQAQVEERPENFLAANRDGNNALMTAREVQAGGARELTTDLPVDVITDVLSGYGGRQAVFTSASDPNYRPDRSAYLCNYLGYNLAAEFGRSPGTTAGFIHITPDTPADQMHAVLEAVTARQLEQRRSPAPVS